MKILGVGVDIASNKRFIQLLQKTYSDRFLARVLHEKIERPELQSKKSLEEKGRYLASRWAFKEALVKATGNRELVFSQLCLRKEESGRPHIVFEGDNKPIADKLGISETHVSISHQDEYSVAFVVAMCRL